MLAVFQEAKRLAARLMGGVQNAANKRFQVSVGTIDVKGITGSPVHEELSNRAIVVPTHDDGFSANFYNYGIAFDDRAGPEAEKLIEHLRSIQRALYPGEVYVTKIPNHPFVIFASVFDFKGRDPEKTVKLAVTNAMRAAGGLGLTHVDFALLDGGYKSATSRVLSSEVTARAMAEGLIDYAQSGGQSSAAVILHPETPAASQSNFTNVFNYTLAAHDRMQTGVSLDVQNPRPAYVV